MTGLVTDCAANMIACANVLNLRHIMCFAHVLNLVVRRSLTQTPELEEIRSRGRRIVGHFKSSTTAKEKLSEMQRQMARPEHKLIQEVTTIPLLILDMCHSYCNCDVFFPHEPLLTCVSCYLILGGHKVEQHILHAGKAV